MILSFQNYVDCVLLICKNSTLSKNAKINKIKIHQTSTIDYLMLSVICDSDFVINCWLGLSKNEQTKNEKFYSVCGLTIDIDKINRANFGIGEAYITLFNRCCVALNAFCVGVDFLKDEVLQCLN